MKSSLVFDTRRGEERLFDSFEAGAECGRATFALDSDLSAQLNDLLQSARSDDRIPMAAVPLLLMRAFTTVVPNRPPGNIHVGQICKLFELPKADAVMEARVACMKKETKKDRRIVHFDVTLSDLRSGRVMMSGVSTIFWSA